MLVRSADDERGSRRPQAIFWLGAGLAAVAALILLAVPGNTALRIGTLLGLLAVVLIGRSVSLRAPETGAVTQATLRRLDERLWALQAEVLGLRSGFTGGAAAGAGARSPAVGWPDAAYPSDGGSIRGPYAIAPSAPHLRDVLEPEFAGAQPRAASGNFGAASVAQPGGPPPSSGRAAVPSSTGRHPVATGVVRHTETVHVTTRQTIVEPDANRPENVYGSVYAAAGTGWTAPGQRSGTSAGPDRAWPPADVQPDRAGDGPEPSPTGTHPEREWETGRRPRAGRARARYESDDAVGAAEPAGHPPAAERASRSWRAEDRWASVRDDAEGREVHVGRRRAAGRADDTGTEMRVEDHWAAVQQAYPHGGRLADGGGAGERPAGSGEASEWRAGSGEASERRTDARGGHDWSASGRVRSTPVGEADWVDRDLSARWEDQSRADQPVVGDGGAPADRSSTGRVWRPRIPAALPAAAGESADGSAGSWRDGWSEPEREPVRTASRAADDHEAYRLPPSERSPRAGSRQVGFERSDARWG